MPIQNEFFLLLEVPKKEQIPKNLVRTMFSVKKPTINILTRDILFPPYLDKID